MTLSLAFLDPKLVQLAIRGSLPRGFGTKRLAELPMLWPEQWRPASIREPSKAGNANLRTRDTVAKWRPRISFGKHSLKIHSGLDHPLCRCAPYG
jgi:hypothetical protein